MLQFFGDFFPNEKKYNIYNIFILQKLQHNQTWMLVTISSSHLRSNFEHKKNCQTNLIPTCKETVAATSDLFD